MAKKKKTKLTVDFSNFTEYLKRLEQLGGITAMKKGVEAGLKDSKAHVNDKLEIATSPAKLPRKGKYSTGQTQQSIDRDMAVKWTGLKATIPIGFDFEKSGLTSIFLMYGTPKMKPAKGMKAAIYGAKAKKEHKEIVAEALERTISEIIGD